jgi:hypothetical protein
VAASAGADRERILLNCSHTHAGPPSATVGLCGLGEPDHRYIDSLPAQVAETAARAAGALQPVKAAYGTAPVRIGINRRERTPEGAITLGRNPQGLTDETVRTLRLSDEAGDVVAVLFNHACHGTTLGGGNREISSEWMGEACERLRGHLGPRAVPMFLQGCCGQINPDRRGDDRSFGEVARLGGMMAEAVQTALAGAEPVRLAPVRSRLEHVQLSLQDPPSPASARAGVESAQRDLKQARRDRANPYWVRALECQVWYAQWLLSLAESGAKGLTLEFAIQALVLGEVAIVGLSGEVFLDFAGQIAAESPFTHTIVLGYSNGCTGYVPTAEAFAEGGYEPEGSFRWYGTLPLAPEAGKVMAAEAVRMLGLVKGSEVSPRGLAKP